MFDFFLFSQIMMKYSKDRIVRISIAIATVMMMMTIINGVRLQIQRQRKVGIVHVVERIIVALHPQSAALPPPLPQPQHQQPHVNR